MQKSQLDKFYTKPEIAQHCVNTLKSITNIDLWLEPSAGAGAFYNRLPEPKLGLDLVPDSSDIIEQDYFTYKAPTGLNIAVIGNPPFGKNSSLAIKFFNYSAKFATVIAFIVPKTFKKVSTQNKLSLDWVLTYQEELPKNSFQLFSDDGNIYDYDVPCVWQIWVRGTRSKIILDTDHKDWEWVNKQEANYAIRRVGALAGKCFEEFEQYASSSNYFIKTTPQVYKNLSSLYDEFQKAAKDTAGNPSLGKGELVYIYKQKFK